MTLTNFGWIWLVIESVIYGGFLAFMVYAFIFFINEYKESKKFVLRLKIIKLKY